MGISPREIGIQWFTEVWNGRQANLIPTLLAPDAKGHLEGGQEICGPDEFMEFHQSMLSAIPDLHVEILNTLADGDDVCVLWQASGRHSGHGFGLPPTGNSVTFRGITWLHVEEGKIAEGWDCWNHGAVTATMAGLAD